MLFIFCIFLFLLCLLAVFLYVILRADTTLDIMTDDKMQEEFLRNYDTKFPKENNMQNT